MSTKNYTYDAEKLSEEGLDLMRFELGDTTFAPAELTAALCDEEYRAILSRNKRWKRAKVKCLEAILMRFAHQVDVSVDGLSYSFAQRIAFWQDLLKEAKLENSTAIPTAGMLDSKTAGPPYFYSDMHANGRKTASGNNRKVWR